MLIPIRKEPIFFDNKDFQTVQIKVIFSFEKKESEIAKMNLLPNLLNFVCNKYQTEEEFRIVCDKNYVLANFCSCNILGNTANITYNFVIPDQNTMIENCLENQFKIFHEMMYHPKIIDNQFTKEEFDREITNMKNNIEKALENVDSYAMIKSKEFIDDNHFFSNTIYNHQEQINDLTEKNMYEFYLDKIKNNQPSIFVFGNVINKNEFMKYCKKYLYLKEFENTSMNLELKRYFPIRDKKKEKIEKSSFHNTFYITYYTVKDMTEKDESTLAVVKELLSSSSSRLLAKKLRDEGEYVYSSFAYSFSNYGILGICSMIHKKNLKEVKEKTKEVFQELKNIKTITPLLKSIKEKHRINLIRELDNKGLLFYNEIIKELKYDITTEEVYKEILKITPKDIVEFVDRLVLDTTYILEEGDK